MEAIKEIIFGLLAMTGIVWWSVSLYKFFETASRAMTEDVVLKAAKRTVVRVDFLKRKIQVCGEVDFGTEEDQMWIKYEAQKAREEAERNAKGGSLATKK